MGNVNYVDGKWSTPPSLSLSLSATKVPGITDKETKPGKMEGPSAWCIPAWRWSGTSGQCQQVPPKPLSSHGARKRAASQDSDPQTRASQKTRG